MMKTRELQEEDIFSGFQAAEEQRLSQKKDSFNYPGNDDTKPQIVQRGSRRSGTQTFGFPQKKKKKKIGLMDRLMKQIAKEEEFMKKNESHLKVVSKTKETKLSRKVAETFKKEEKLNEYEKVDQELVGQKQFEKNLDVELEAQNAELERIFECPEGCGRSFRKKALSKHTKICKKIFQTRRQEFKSDKTRMVNKEQKLMAKRGARKMELNKNLKGSKKKKNWKKESSKLRQFIKKKGFKKTGNEIEVEIKVKVGKI